MLSASCATVGGSALARSEVSLALREQQPENENDGTAFTDCSRCQRDGRDHRELFDDKGKMILETSSARPSSPSAFVIGRGFRCAARLCCSESEAAPFRRNLLVRVLTPSAAAAGSWRLGTLRRRLSCKRITAHRGSAAYLNEKCSLPCALLLDARERAARSACLMRASELRDLPP